MAETAKKLKSSQGLMQGLEEVIEAEGMGSKRDLTLKSLYSGQLCITAGEQLGEIYVKKIMDRKVKEFNCVTKEFSWEILGNWLVSLEEDRVLKENEDEDY